MCGNYESLIPVCKNDIYDHFWAMIRTSFLFDLRKKLLSFGEQNHTVEKLCKEDYLELGLPFEIPNKWHSSFDGILRCLQQNHSESFKKAHTRLQFNSVVPAILSNWDLIIDNLAVFSQQYFEDTKEGVLEQIHTSRFAAHLAIIIKSNHTISQEKLQLAEEIIGRYIKSLINKQSNLDIILFYFRYITDVEFMMDISQGLFITYQEQNQRERCVNFLKIYSPRLHQAILSEIIMNIIEFKNVEIYHNNVLNTLLVSENYPIDRVIQELINLIKPPIQNDSIESLLKLLRKLIISCKITRAHELVILLFHANPENYCHLYEREYWSKFIDALKSYSNYQSHKMTDFFSKNQDESFSRSSVEVVNNLNENNIHRLEM